MLLQQICAKMMQKWSQNGDFYGTKTIHVAPDGTREVFYVLVCTSNDFLISLWSVQGTRTAGSGCCSGGQYGVRVLRRRNRVCHRPRARKGLGGRISWTPFMGSSRSTCSSRSASRPHSAWPPGLGATGFSAAPSDISGERSMIS